MKENIKKYSFFILTPVVLGIIVGVVTASSNDYSSLKLPSYAPPGWVFPIVWILLYALMGIASCIIASSDNKDKGKALKQYVFQLFVNYMWSIIFFTLKFRYAAFAWIVFLIFLVYFLIKKFRVISDKSAKFLIPYFLWIMFAATLNFGVAVLN